MLGAESKMRSRLASCLKSKQENKSKRLKSGVASTRSHIIYRHVFPVIDTAPIVSSAMHPRVFLNYVWCSWYKWDVAVGMAHQKAIN